MPSHHLHSFSLFHYVERAIRFLNSLRISTNWVRFVINACMCMYSTWCCWHMVRERSEYCMQFARTLSDAHITITLLYTPYSIHHTVRYHQLHFSLPYTLCLCALVCLVNFVAFPIYIYIYACNIHNNVRV